MRRWPLLLLSLFAGSAIGRAQIILPLSTDPASQAMGGVISPFSRYYQSAGNPALLAAVPTKGLSAYTLQPFGLTELSTSYLQGWIPKGQGGWGGGISYSGFSGLRHIGMYTGFGHRLWNRLDVGIQMEWQQVRLSDFGQQHHVNISAGLRGYLRSDLAIGLVVRYPPLFRNTGSNHLPAIMIGTLAYRLSDQMELVAEWFQEERLEPDFRFGFSYRPVPQIPVRFGYQARLGTFTAGAGYVWRDQWSMDLSAGYHPYLGFSPSAGLIWALPVRK